MKTHYAYVESKTRKYKFSRTPQESHFPILKISATNHYSMMTFNVLVITATQKVISHKLIFAVLIRVIKFDK